MRECVDGEWIRRGKKLPTVQTFSDSHFRQVRELLLPPFIDFARGV